MGRDPRDDIELVWVCGNCDRRVYYLAVEEPPGVCPHCGYKIGERDVKDVPEEVRLKIHR